MKVLQDPALRTVLEFQDGSSGVLVRRQPSSPWVSPSASCGLRWVLVSSALRPFRVAAQSLEYLLQLLTGVELCHQFDRVAILDAPRFRGVPVRFLQYRYCLQVCTRDHSVREPSHLFRYCRFLLFPV